MHSHPATLRQLIPLLCGLGIAQIISWGSLYYTIAVLGESMRRDLGISETLLFGAFTLSLLVSGLVAPWAGRLIDEKGGRPVLAAGSLLAGLALLALACARGPWMLGLGSVLSGVAMALCLYDAVFSALNHVAGGFYRQAVTAVTLFGGFASTLFWPLSQVLMDAVGWRETLIWYAGLHVLVALPLHIWLLPRRHVAPVAAVTPAQELSSTAPASLAWLALAFALGAFVFSALSVHLIGLLKSAGLSARDAVVVAALIGPMQVLGRIVEFGFARQVRPVTVGTSSFVMILLAMLVLWLVPVLPSAALVFAVLYGFSNGIMTIVRGTVPAQLFGRVGYGALLGRLARPAFIAKAVAPVVFSLALAAGLARANAVLLLAACGAASLAAYLVAIRRASIDGLG